MSVCRGKPNKIVSVRTHYEFYYIVPIRSKAPAVHSDYSGIAANPIRFNGQQE